MKRRTKSAKTVLERIEDRIDLRDATKALKEVGAGQTVTLEELEREMKGNDSQEVAPK